MTLYRTALYRVKRGQTASEISRAFGVPLSVLVRENGLTKEVEEGQVLSIPPAPCALYCVRGGESKTQLCGSPEAFSEKNGTDALYPTQTVVL